MRREELEATAKALESVIDPKDEKVAEKAQEPTLTQLLGKALDVVKSVLPSRLSKAFPMPPPEDDEEEEEKKKKMMMAGGGGAPGGMPFGKSGETKQPHGDQNSLNTGEMSSKKRIPKKFNYDAKMEDTGVDYPSNSEVEYEPYKERHEVHKSISDIQNDGDLSDEDKVFVVNDWLEKGFKQIDEMQKSIDAIIYTQGVLVKAMKHFVDLGQAQGNAGRGRISAINVMDKSVSGSMTNNGNGNTTDLSRTQIESRALKAQKSGKLDYNSVALVNTCLNGDPMSGIQPTLPPKHIMDIIASTPD